ncbi:MAG TPA: DUF4340 domain-containing protein [Bryobacteraceae bacterium]|nr:DUF4340 domain-containing protein [Bryobacteraceae bacterium]
MKFARLLIAAVVLAGLAGAVLWSNKAEDAKAKNPPPDKNAPAKILSLTEADIRQVEIKKRDGPDTIVKKDDSGKWSIAAPKPLPADQAAVGGVTSAATGLTADRLVDQKASDLASYGLQPAKIEVDYTMKDGRIDKLLIGDDTPTGSGSYAMAGGDPRLFTISTFNKGNFDKETKDLRDKRMMTFDQDKVSRVELTAKKQNLEFGKIGQNDWQILKPKPLRADGWQVEELVRKVKEANMDTTASGDDLKKAAAAFASGTPVALVKVTEPAGTQTMEVRKNKDDYYAKSSVVDGVHKMTKDLGEGVDKSLDDFRNKKLFDFGFNDPTRIDYKDTSARTYTLEKSGDKWMSAGKAMDSTSVQAFIDKLRDLAATKFVDTGFATPVVEITVTSNDGKRSEHIQISGAGDKTIAKRVGEDTEYLLDANAVKDLRDAADVKPAASAPPAAKK